jgi:hypothetical protein
MGYWPLSRPSKNNSGAVDPPGYEDADETEIIHCFFEHDHASGVQDSAGKDARFPILTQLGFKSTAVYNYNECYELSRVNNAVPDPKRKREGYWQANGAYVWVAFSDGEDAHRDKHGVLDFAVKSTRLLQEALSDGSSARCYPNKAVMPKRQQSCPGVSSVAASSAGII